MAFLHESPLLDLEVYRLLAMLEASPALAEFQSDYQPDENRVGAIRMLEFPEISRIVVSLAAIIRSSVDAAPGAYRGGPGLELERPVGVLIPDTSRPSSGKALDFREACNKVLHSDRVELEREPETDALTGELVMEGRYRGNEWRAHLDLRSYALTALALT